MNKDKFTTWNSTDCHCSHHGLNDNHAAYDPKTPKGLVQDFPSGAEAEDKIPNPPRKTSSGPTKSRPYERSGSYGRRRSESAPDALLDCLHCGKDLTAPKSPRRREHTRRYTVASARRPPSPIKYSSVRRLSSHQKERRGDGGRVFQIGVDRCRLCSNDRRRPCGTVWGGAERGLVEDRYCGICSTGDIRTSTTTTTQRRRKPASFHVCEDCRINRGGILQSSLKKFPPCRSGDCPSKIPRSFAAKHSCLTDTSDDIPGDIFDDRLRRRSVDFDHSTLKRSDLDLEDDTTNDDDDTEGGYAINVNENRRRQSLTSFSDIRRGGSGGKSGSPDKRKRRSYPGYTSKKHMSPLLVDNLVEQVHDHVHVPCMHNHSSKMTSHKRRSAISQGGGTLRSTRRQQLIATEEGADADEEESESVDDDVAPTRRDSLLMTHLTAMWRRHRLCDVILRSEGQKIAAHKLALAAFSETFARRYCEGESAELSQVVMIDVPDSSAGGIQEVLRFVYTGVIRITPDNLAHVLAAAAFLHINEIVNLCKQMLLKPDVETVIFFSCLAEKYQLSENLGFFYDFMCKHFLRVSRTRGWKTLTFGQVFDLLSEDNLSVERELDIFHAAVAWIDADRANRLTFAADLIGCVRFAYITPDEIAKHVETKQFLFQGDEGKELLLCIYRHHALQTCGCQHGQRMHRLPRRKYTPMMAARDQCNSAYSPPVPASTRQTISRNVPRTLTSSYCDVILSVGGVNPFQPEVEPQARLVEQFHPRENHWTTLTHLPDGRHHHGVAVVEGGIYVIGGSVLDDLNPGHLCNPTTSCYRYDLSSGQWSAVAPLNTPRMYHATTVINDVIFVIAGQTQHSRHLSSMECYRPEVDEWEAGVAMKEGRIGVAVAGYRGQLFAVGGFLETQHEHVVRSTVEIFDPGECRWTSRNNLPTPRCHAGLAECVGKLYLVGGSTFPAESPTVCSLPSVLRYDELDDRWDTIQTLQTPRHDMGITVLGCRILIVGGVSSTENNVLSDVECYDVEGDYWLDDVEPIRSPALGLVCVTVLANS